MRGLTAYLGAALLALACCVPASAAAPELDARAWTLIDARTGERLAGERDSAARPVASATKLMTARLALQSLDLGSRVRAPRYDALPVESKINLRRGERMTVRDLLYALMLESANDAAATLAVAVSGSIPAFVDEMNAEAVRLGLSSTGYRNPIGLDAPGHVSSARDLAKLTRALMRNKTFARIADSERAVLRSGDRTRRLVTRNDLLLRHPPLTGVKTGHTRRAGYVLVGSERSADLRLISVVLGAPSERARDAESLRLLRYGMSLFRRESPLRASQTLARADVRFEDAPLALRAAQPVVFSVRRGARIRRDIDAPAQVEGPVEAGRRLGRVRYVVDGRVVGESALLAGRDVAEPGALDRIEDALPVPFAVALMLAGVIVMLYVASASRRSRLRRQRRRAAARGRQAR